MQIEQQRTLTAALFQAYQMAATNHVGAIVTVRQVVERRDYENDGYTNARQVEDFHKGMADTAHAAYKEAKKLLFHMTIWRYQDQESA